MKLGLASGEERGFLASLMRDLYWRAPFDFDIDKIKCPKARTRL